MQKEIFLLFIMSIILCSNNGFSQSLNGHEYVDLGLPSGTKWAKCNIGAKTETDFGYYFAWGGTKSKNTFTEENYNYEKQESYVDSDGFTHNRDKNIVSISGDSKYDAATANWGKGWSMPTREQFDELIYNCNWEWVSKNGVYGYKVTGNNGKYIFLPATGCRLWSNILNEGEQGDYWSGSLDKKTSGNPYHLYFLSYGPGTDDSFGFYGYSIRPIYGCSRISSVESQAFEYAAHLPSGNDSKGETKENVEPTQTSRTDGRVNFGGLFGGSGSGNGNPGWWGGSGSGGGSGTGPAGGVGGSIGNRKVISKVYPENKDNMTGTVKLKITVNEKGIVETAEPTSETTCSECVPFAIKAVKQWKYEAKPGSGTQTGIVTVEYKLR